MSKRIRDLILDQYAYPERTIERNLMRQHGQRSVKWHG